MIGWLWRMIAGRFTSCDHKWSEVNHFDVMYDRNGTKRQAAVIILMKCDKCGSLHNHRVSR